MSGHNSRREVSMKICSTALVAMILAAFTIQTVDAKHVGDNPNSGYCKSGKHVRDVAKCKENGGKR